MAAPKLFELSSSIKQDIYFAATMVFQKVLDALEKAGKREAKHTGGFLRIRYAFSETDGLRGWHELYQHRLGDREGDYWETVEDFSQEKVFRLVEEHARNSHHVSSWQSADDNRRRFPGAAILNANIEELGGRVKILISFSGLPADADEAFDLLLAKEMKWNSNLAEFATVISRPDEDDAEAHNDFAWDLVAPVTFWR